ncbi:cAMP-binding domain of CRP or a regulatory subunit of cAMP-dependent protein kinases [Lentzea xinjiangensis]|uniref:cAMP-binding domain of CRP or a regulatory subunit of cAMP-dependent protein kinases n=1 Tax=Lentzea xinjiangensis TaxID=402600 RepID=A0A1H9MH45_9PSEU|nr:Crp/Fnr family transcriptional regulator [Lentzea xinjiangensis]SER22978.1 cAMP-binding domain of CRP or a regulatory subunit of cAMP-dependent protein kinases [Lentzea xinjiangensis]
MSRSWVPGSIFDHLSEVDHRIVVEAGARREFPSNEVLLRQGDPTDHVFVLLSGWVRVSASTEGGRDLLLAFRGPGEVVGDLAAVHGTDRTASVRALEPVRVVQLRRERFVDLLRDQPAISMAMIKQLSARLVELGETRMLFAPLDVTRRVAACLLRLVELHGVPVANGIALRIRLSQQDVAGQVDASARSVARAFAVLRDRGIVTSTRARVVIGRPDVLRALAGYPPDGR